MEDTTRIHSKVRALLAKAESTDYPEEAAIYTAKAQELIARHAIDTAMLEEREGRGAIVTRLIDVPSPYPKEKFILLSGIARANNCRAILGFEPSTLKQLLADGQTDRADNLATVVGYESDLDAVEMLFTSLLVQAVNEVMAHGSQVTPWGENRTKSFRRSFLNQFAHIVGSRLAEATEAARTEAATTSSASLLPVLANREEAVEAELRQRFPNTSSLRTSVSNHAGVVAGQAAGQRADIGSTRLRGRRSAISQ